MSRVLHKLTALDVQTVSQIITAQLTSCACYRYSEDLSLSVRKMSFVMRWLQNPAPYSKATKTAFWIGRDVSWAVNCGLPNAKPSCITRVFYVQFIVDMVTRSQVFSEHFRLSMLFIIPPVLYTRLSPWTDAIEPLKTSKSKDLLSSKLHGAPSLSEYTLFACNTFITQNEILSFLLLLL